jgi:hypothetical protein
VKDYIPKAFKNADTMILDGEILLMDAHTRQPLPFGTLGRWREGGGGEEERGGERRGEGRGEEVRGGWTAKFY